MPAAARPIGYSTAQIVLHWVIAALVVFQLVFGEEIADAYRAYRRGTTPDAEALFQSNIHVYIGLAVLALAVVRLALRIIHGAPPLPAGQPRIQDGDRPSRPSRSSTSRSSPCRSAARWRGTSTSPWPAKSTNWPSRSSS